MPRCSKRTRSSTANGLEADPIPGATSLDEHHHQKRSRNTSTKRHSKVEETFNIKKCIMWFKQYTTNEEPEVIGPSGVEKFCSDLKVHPEDVVMLVIAHKMGAKQMGYFTQTEWLTGLSDVQCDNLMKLRNKLAVLRSSLNDPNTFKAVYRYSYDFARDKEQRSLDTPTAIALLVVLLPRWSLCGTFCEYLGRSRYRVVNKDQWCNILEFTRAVDDNLTNYDADGAWPVMLDEFVDWVRAGREMAMLPDS